MLIALIALPTVPITDEVLAVVAIAPPVAVAVYAGWYRPTAHSPVAAVAALCSAVLGAWLGFHVPGAPALGALTAIIGAVLAANLALITVDVAVPEPAGEPEVPQAETLPGPA